MEDVMYEELRELFNESGISRHAEDMEEYDEFCERRSAKLKRYCEQIVATINDVHELIRQYDKIYSLTDDTAVYQIFLEKYFTLEVVPDSLPYMYFEVEQFLHDKNKTYGEHLSFGKTLYQKLVLCRMTAPDTDLINRLIYRTLVSMLSALLNLNHSNESLQLHRKILYFVKKYFKDEPHLVFNEMGTYEAFLSLEYGMQKEANKVRYEMLKYSEEHFGHYSKETADAFWSLSSCKDRKKYLDEVAHILKSIEQTDGTISDMEALAQEYQNEEEYKQEYELRRIVFNYQRKNLGENHTATFDALKLLIQVMKKLGQVYEAEMMYNVAKEKQQQFLENQIKILGSKKKKLYYMEELIDLFLEDEKYDRAIEVRKQLVSEAERICGLYSDEYETAKVRLDSLLEERGIKSRERYTDFLKGKLKYVKDKYGVEDWRTLNVVSSLAYHLRVKEEQLALYEQIFFLVKTKYDSGECGVYSYTNAMEEYARILNEFEERKAEALKWQRELVRLLREAEPEDASEYLSIMMRRLSEMLKEAGEISESQRVSDEENKIREKYC
ncbi:MAG: hypothetical protein IJG33_12350 [Selenomonadaceae bacterium]|nr:hypothetical protein [Selenomonadaceae bacterium]